MSMSEDLLSKAGRFQNGGKDIMFIDGATNSDKKKQTTFQLPRIKLNKGVISGKQINKSVLASSKLLDDSIGIVKAEAQRIFEVRSASSATKDILTAKHGKHYVNNSQFFFGYKFLNGLLRFDNTMQLDLEAETEIDGKKMKVKDMLVGIATGNSEHITALKNVVAEYYINKVENDVLFWEKNGLIKRADDGSGKIIEAPIDKTYASDNRAKLDLENMDEAFRFMLLEMSLNSAVALHNEIMLISGDPAQMGKSVVGFIEAVDSRMEKRGIDKITRNSLRILLGLDESMAEFQKRLASNIAPSRGVLPGVLNIGKRTLRDTYRTVFTADMKPDFKTYAESLASAAGVSASDLKGDGSDALEWVTLEHKLESMLRDGAISDTEFTEILDAYNNGKGTLSEKQLQMVILGAGKPLQVDYKISKIPSSNAGEELSVMKKIYIKSAEMPLIAQLTKSLDGPIDGLRAAMEKNGVGRMTHISAAKLGAEHVVNIYDSKNNILSEEDLNKMFESNKANETRMSWEGFGYQLDMHADESGEGVSMATQADKTLFDGLLGETFSHNGESVLGRDLLERKNSILLETQMANEAKLDADLGYSGGRISKESLKKIIVENADKLKWNNNDVLSAISAINSGAPLMFSPISAKLESLIASLYTNRVLKYKRNGFALVQFPHLGKKRTVKGATKEDVKETIGRGGAIMTSEYDPSKGLRYSRSKDGNVTLMEIVVPFKFWSANKLLNPADFSENGVISADKLDPELLRIVGLRIPNQGHSSQVMCKIVGFLPRWAGDQCLVPPEIVIQMGSDFDIDKLYTYWRNSFLSSDGKIVSIPKNVVEFDSEHNAKVNESKLDAWRSKTFASALKKQKDVSQRLKEAKKNKKLSDYINSLTRTTEYTTTGWVDTDDATSTDDRADMWDAVVKELGYSPDDLYVPSLSQLKSKALEDAYVDIFDTVLSHENVVQKSMQPLDAPDLVNLGEESASMEPKGEIGDYIRQSIDYMSQSGAKTGISVYSKNVPGLVLMEGKDVRFIKTTEDGNIVDNPFVKFADDKGNVLELVHVTPSGNSTYTMPDGKKKKRTGIKNVIIQQSGAVDNAKDPVLFKNNMNIKTFGLSALISAMADSNNRGVSLETNTRFLRQPAIVMLTDLLRSSDSTVISYEDQENKYVPNAVETIKRRISAGLSEVEIETQKSNLADHAYTAQELYEMEQAPDMKNPLYVAKQIEMLDMFNDLYNRSWAMSNVVTMASLDSRGMMPSFYDNQLKLDQVSRAIGSSEVRNASNMWSRDGSMRVSREDGIYKTSISPDDKVNPTGNGVRVASKGHRAIGNAFGYTDSFINDAISLVEVVKGTTTRPITLAKATTRKAVARALKSYLYSKIDFLKGDTYASLVDSKLIANQLLKLKSDPALASNIFVQTLQVVRDNKNIEMNARTVDGPMSDNLIRGFYELAMSENPEYVSFAANIIKYELLIGGIQSPQSALKYIAQDVIDQWGITKQISDVYKKLNQSEVEYFTDLFFRNNPGEAQYVLKETKTDKKYRKNGGLEFMINKDADGFVGDIMYSKLTTAIGDDIIPKKFIRIVDEKYNVLLFQINNEKSNAGVLHYDQVQILGSEGVSGRVDRNFSNYSSRPAVVVAPTIQPKVVQSPVIPTPASTVPVYKSDFIMDEFPDGITVKDAGAAMLRMENSQLKWIGGIINMMPITIGNIIYRETSNGRSSAEYDPNTGIIYVYRKELSDGIDTFGADYAYETIAHELYHAIEHNAYFLGKNGQKDFKQVYNNVNSIFDDARNALADQDIVEIRTGNVMYSERGEKLKYKDFLKVIGDPIAFDEALYQAFPSESSAQYRNDLRLTMHALGNAEEFMAILNSNVIFQKQMDGILVSDRTAKLIKTPRNKSLFMAFLEQFAKMFSQLNPMFTVDSFGNKASVNSILEAVYINQAILIDKMGVKIQEAPSGTSQKSVSRDLGNRNLDEFDGNIKPKENEDIIKPGDVGAGHSFTYNGVTIDTEFQLSKDQSDALIALIDFAEKGASGHPIQDVMTLQGAAGTGKTAIIGYLQKYLGGKYAFAYMAPTHAATAELAFATAKTGNTTLPSTVASGVNTKKGDDGVYRSVFSIKIKRQLEGSMRSIIVVDESSMLDGSDVIKLQQAVKDFGSRLIFIGDEKQIPKVSDEDEDGFSPSMEPSTEKLSPAFTKFKKVSLNKVHRTSSDSTLAVLSRMRDQNTFKLFKTKNTDALKFVSKAEYNSMLIEDLKNDPENTVQVAYKNESVSAANVQMRNELGRHGNTVVGDIVMGYIGYASKQIEKGNIANSISYTIRKITPVGGARELEVESSKLRRLSDAGIKQISPIGRTTYFQLRNEDSLKFGISQAEMDQNNKDVSSYFRKIHNLNVRYGKREMDYRSYQDALTVMSMQIAGISVGDKYIYNPSTDRMEKYDKRIHSKIKHTGQGSLLFDKDIDYGHAITIHKSQGATIKNVYFDVESLNAASNTPILDENNKQVTTERQAIAYVALSRSSNKMVVYTGNSYFEPVIGDNGMLMSVAMEPVKSDPIIPTDINAELTGTIADFLRNSGKDVRFAFRNALNNKLFKTKCD